MANTKRAPDPNPPKKGKDPMRRALSRPWSFAVQTTSRRCGMAYGHTLDSDRPTYEPAATTDGSQ